MLTSYLLWALLAPTSPAAQPISGPAAALIVFEEPEVTYPDWSGSMTVKTSLNAGGFVWND